MVNARDYLRVIGSTALDGVVAAAWIAAGELPTGKRRSARAAMMAAGTAIRWVAEPAEDRPVTWTREGGFVLLPGREKDDVADPEPEPPRSNAAALVAIALAGGVIVGERALKNRWLARLERAGHPHPHRALGVRVGLLTVAASLPPKVMLLHAGLLKPR